MTIVLLSCAGILLVMLNRPIGEVFRRMNLGMGHRDYDGDWPYRAPLIIVGVLLACLSFFAD